MTRMSQKNFRESNERGQMEGKVLAPIYGRYFQDGARRGDSTLSATFCRMMMMKMVVMILVYGDAFHSPSLLKSAEGEALRLQGSCRASVDLILISISTQFEQST